MGQRANLITIEKGEFTIRYDHWCANQLHNILFWGAGYALDYFDAQEEVGAEGLLDEVWAEGGAVLDLDKKHLLWWGGEDVLYELPLRRVYLKLQKKVWEDWTIEWAHRGIIDLAEYIGLPKEKVLTSRENLSEPMKIKSVEEDSWVITLGSIMTVEGNIKLFVLPANTENYLYNGINLVNQCKLEKGLEKVIWKDWEKNDENFPQSGFWIDEKSRTVEFWGVRDCPNVVQDLRNIWGDWEINWHQDNYEFQVEKLGNKIVLPEINESILIKRLRENLLREDGRSGIQSALDTNETLRSQGMKVEINPWMFKSHHVKQPLESKIQIWQRNFGE